MVPVPLEMYLSFFVANYSSTFARLEGGGAAASVKVGLVPVVFVMDVGAGCPSSQRSAELCWCGGTWLGAWVE